MFTGLVKNEFIKLFSKKKTYIILGLFIILLIILAFINETSEKDYFYYNDLDFQIQNIQEQIKYEKEYQESIKSQTELSEEEIEMNLRYSKEYINSLEEELISLQNKKNVNYDWREDYKGRLEYIKEQVEYLSEGEISKDEARQKASFLQEIEKIEWLLSTDTSPDDEHLNTSANYLYTNIAIISAAFLTFGLILLSGEYNPGTLKFLLIQPVTRIKVLLSKFFVMVLSSLALIIGGQGLVTLIVGLLKGFGNFQRPMLVGQKFEVIMENGYQTMQDVSGSGNFIPLWKYIILMLILEVFLIITITAFIFMISTLSKSSIVATTLGISLLLGSNIIYSLSTKYRKLSYLNFFHFGDIEGILSGSIVRQTNAFLFTYTNVIIVCIVSTLVFVGIALGVFKKRDLLI